MGSIKDQKSYDIGFNIGIILSNIIWGILKILYNGIIVASMKYSVLIFVYIGLIIVAIINYYGVGNYELPLLVLLIAITFMGISINIEEYPKRKRREFFNGIFENINFHSLDGNIPYFLNEKDISNFAYILTFETFIPLKEWNKKRETLEMYFNEQIIDIKQDKENKNNIHIIIQSQPLLTSIKWDDEFIDKEKDIFNIGIGYYEGFAHMDLLKQPHAFIAGETGSGKSNILKCMIHQALEKQYEVLLIDFKRGVSFSEFTDKVSICFEHGIALTRLEFAVYETKRRLDLFRKYGVENLKEYNNITDDYELKRQIIFIDELAELLGADDKEISKLIIKKLETLSRLSRAVGIHLIMGLQRLDSTIVNGQIKNNVAFRVCGRFKDPEPSRIMLGNDRANNLPDIKGRVIVSSDEDEEIQSFYYSNALNDHLSEEIIDNEDLYDKDDLTANMEQLKGFEQEEKAEEETEIQKNIVLDFSNAKKWYKDRNSEE